MVQEHQVVEVATDRLDAPQEAEAAASVAFALMIASKKQAQGTVIQSEVY